MNGFLCSEYQLKMCWCASFNETHFFFSKIEWWGAKVCVFEHLGERKVTVTLGEMKILTVSEIAVTLINQGKQFKRIVGEGLQIKSPNFNQS